MFPQVWKKKLKFLLQSSYLQNAHTLPRHHSWHLKLLKNSWNISWTLLMAVMPRKENQLACVVFMLMTRSLLEPQSSWRSSRKLSSHNSRLVMKMWMTWCSLVNVSNGSLMRKRNLTLLLNSPCVSVNVLRLSYPKVGRIKTNATKISTLPMLGLPDSVYEKYEDMYSKCQFFHCTTAKGQFFPHSSNQLWRCYLCWPCWNPVEEEQVRGVACSWWCIKLTLGYSTILTEQQRDYSSSKVVGWWEKLYA